MWKVVKYGMLLLQRLRSLVRDYSNDILLSYKVDYKRIIKILCFHKGNEYIFRNEWFLWNL